MDWSRQPKIKRVADMLWQGAVIAYPTESVWGLGCAAHNCAAVYKLLALKKRDVEKGLILIADDISRFKEFLEPLSPDQIAKIESTWPGPVTWLIPDLDNRAPSWIKGRHTSVALRVSDHPVVKGLCQSYGGAIVSTSANPQGMQAAKEAWQVRRYFSDSLDYITPGIVGGNKNPSQIRDLLSGDIVR
jgi:L-threonylcarbamoyladenylate synthase